MTDTTLILAMLVMCFFPIGLKFICSEGEIFAGFGAWMRNTVVPMFPEWMHNPLWICPRCMVPYWGLGAALLVMYAPWYIYGLPFIVTAIGIQDTLDR